MLYKADWLEARERFTALWQGRLTGRPRRKRRTGGETQD
jgi:hypothetical protein